MESEMDLEDLSELSELSELEEGEIHDDVEIISEYIPNPPKKPCTSLPRKNISCSKKVIPPPKSAYTPPSSREKTDSRANRTIRSNQRDNSQHRVRSQPPHSGQNAKKTASENNTSKSRSRTSSSLPSTREKSSVKQQTKSDANLGNNKEAEARPLTDSKLGEKNRKIAVCSVPMPEEKRQESPKPNGDSVSEAKWKNTFENVGSVDSDMSISSEDEEDEVMMLRLVALHSLDSNVKPKVPDTEATSAISTPLLDPPSDPPINEEEDEDEELLRAQLLIEVARKQTMESESVQQIPEPKTSDSATTARTETKPEVDIRPTAPPLKNPLLAIPKADRLVIDLRNDSDSSSDEGETAVEDSITALLKSARQTVEKKADIAQSIPQALSHLPRHQQEEYQRLKQEILRREQNRLLQSQHASSKPATPTGQTEESNSDVATSTPAASTTTNAAPRVIVANIPQQPAASKMAVAPVSSTIKLEDVAKENTKTVTPPAAPAAPSRLVVLKHQLVRKKRDLTATKEALQKQLEVVDKNRNLWMKSSQEVVRLKTMLQQAEETEKQLREQFTNSQQQTQRLKTRMQSVERNIMLLQNGLGISRKRTSSLKSRTLTPKASPVKASPTDPFPFMSPSSTTFKVKPRIIAKALAKNFFPNSKMTYVKPSDVSQFTASSMTMPAAGKNLVRLTVKQANPRSKQKKTLTDEAWLFGTLGDDWDDKKTGVRPSTFPPWPCNGQTSRSTSNEMRLDPNRIVCNFNLDSVCRDASCSFQHLPPASSAPSLWTGKAINGGTATTSASQVARATAPSAAVGVSGGLRPTLK